MFRPYGNLIDAARKAVAGHPGAIMELAEALDDVDANLAELSASTSHVEAARQRYANDDIEIDDEPIGVSIADNGVWIPAWLWVEAPDEGEG